MITVTPSAIIKFGCGNGLRSVRLWRRDTDCLLNVTVVDSILLFELNIGMNRVYCLCSDARRQHSQDEIESFWKGIYDAM